MPGAAGSRAPETAAEQRKRNPVHASEYCPVCSRRLAAKSCKLVRACGYYMSCSDCY